MPSWFNQPNKHITCLNHAFLTQWAVGISHRNLDLCNVMYIKSFLSINWLYVYYWEKYQMQETVAMHSDGLSKCNTLHFSCRLRLPRQGELPVAHHDPRVILVRAITVLDQIISIHTSFSIYKVSYYIWRPNVLRLLYIAAGLCSNRSLALTH